MGDVGGEKASCSLMMDSICDLSFTIFTQSSAISQQGSKPVLSVVMWVELEGSGWEGEGPLDFDGGWEDVNHIWLRKWSSMLFWYILTKVKRTLPVSGFIASGWRWVLKEWKRDVVQIMALGASLLQEMGMVGTEKVCLLWAQLWWSRTS